MPIKMAAILPNSPLLLPGLVKDVQNKVRGTVESLQKIRKIVDTQKPAIIVVIAQDDSEGLNCPVLLQASSFKSSFAEHGDLVTSGVVTGAVGFIHSLKERMQNRVSLPMRSPLKIPSSIGIPLLNLPTLPVAPILLPTNTSPQLLFDLGSGLSDFFAAQKEPILLVAAGEIFVNQPKGPENQVLNRAITKAIASTESDSLLQLRANLPSEYNDTLASPVILLYKSLAADNLKTTVFSAYEIFGSTQIVARVTW